MTQSRRNWLSATMLAITGFIVSSKRAFSTPGMLAQSTRDNFFPDFNNHKTNAMKLGAFSISLSVKDIRASKEFYEKLGFSAFGGNMDQKWLIMKNGNALIGLFQGMFDHNILTFNPGWDENAQTMEQFDDVRAIQKELKSKNVSLVKEADEQTKGPAHIVLTDPDGNQILIDQHV